VRFLGKAGLTSHNSEKTRAKEDADATSFDDDDGGYRDDDDEAYELQLSQTPTDFGHDDDTLFISTTPSADNDDADDDDDDDNNKDGSRRHDDDNTTRKKMRRSNLQAAWVRSLESSVTAAWMCP
jgi:hypothetical protein